MMTIRCPVCSGGTTFYVHPKGKGFVIRCTADTAHMHMCDTNPSPPEWWKKYVEHGVWLS
jgi:hypothetical protein